MRRFTHTIGIDDAPFERAHRGDVPIVATVFCGDRLDGVLVDRVRRDGTNATARIARLASASRFAPQLQVILLQGIALAGFNVVDIHALHARLGRAVLVVARRRPDLEAIRAALLGRVRGGARKWALVQRAGAMEPLAGVWVQRAGITAAQAEDLLGRLAIHGRIPEPLRAAHLIAGALGRGHSTGRA